MEPLMGQMYGRFMVKDHNQTQGEVEIGFHGFVLNGQLLIPPAAFGVVLFAHGSGSSRFSPRNQLVARVLREHGLGTLLFDLLTNEEEEADRLSGHLRFDIGLLANRLIGATAWLHEIEPRTPVGYFGSSTGGGAALVAETRSDILISSIVSRGGRPDLAGAALHDVRAPTLLIVGAKDTEVIRMNEAALVSLNCEKQLRVISGATHLFEEPGTLEQVADLAASWFQRHF
jgi:predicted alpha/beta-hydrolase family hydrolase